MGILGRIVSGTTTVRDSVIFWVWIILTFLLGLSLGASI